MFSCNRAMGRWLSLFNVPILSNSAVGDLANTSRQIVNEGTSYQKRLYPHRALKRVIDLPTTTW